MYVPSSEDRYNTASITDKCHFPRLFSSSVPSAVDHALKPGRNLYVSSSMSPPGFYAGLGATELAVGDRSVRTTGVDRR
jgi:hypothetical protein